MTRRDTKLNLDTLKKRARDHLTTQLSMQTYLHELFSPFTAKCVSFFSCKLKQLFRMSRDRHNEVRKLEMLPVIKNWDELKGSEALKEKMVDVATGRLPHASFVLADLLLRTSIKEEEADNSVLGPRK